MKKTILLYAVFLLLVAFVFQPTFIHAQSNSAQYIAENFIRNNQIDWKLSQEDITDLKITDQYTTKHNGLTHIYFIQRHQGITINHALTGVNVTKEGNAFSIKHRFISNIAEKVNSTIPSISAQDALQVVMNSLEIDNTELPRILEQEENKIFLFEKGQIARTHIRVQLCYFKMDENSFNLAWNIIFDENEKIDKWDFQVDALNGSVIQKRDMVFRCKFEGNEYHRHDKYCSDNTPYNSYNKLNTNIQKNENTILTNSYKVFEIPTESPAHGDHVIVSNPADPIASPHGWHDIDDTAGAEFNTTRGNNVHAFQDRDGNLQSENDEPNGGASLDFIFNFNPDDEPEAYTDAATVNLFYIANIMHDITYQYGFDEASGNFQQNTYNNGGVGGDPIKASAQTGADANTFNNAFFSPTPDGLDANLQMLLWDRNGGGNALLQVNEPSSIAGAYETGIPVNASNNVPWFWGEEITLSNMVSGEVVEVHDGVYDPYDTDGCEDYVSGLDLNNKIALVDRGGCDFSTKALNAQNEGAVAVIVCNYLEEIINIQPGVDGDEINIPVLLIKAGDCATIRQFIDNGLDITLTPPSPEGPDYLDGDFDNGIIAHEYAHGISSRLTGGPNSLGCFSSGEHDKAEGWSDFFGLAITVQPGDMGDMNRGYGTYTRREENDGKGYRTFPYSTDMNVNPQTYANININPEVHYRGEIWTAILWDMYWALVEEYTWDENIYTGTGGNNVAIQLVIDGLKLQPCDPSFIESRDAILMADSINNNFTNKCLLWDVFARRGLGSGSSIGSPSFESFSICDKSLKIKKTATPLLSAGEDIQFFITVRNHTEETMTNVVVTDQLPTGLSYVEGTCTIANFTAEDDMMTFSLSNLNAGANLTFTYKAKTDDTQKSISQFFDGAQSTSKWITINDGEADNDWILSTEAPYTGSKSWFVEDAFIQSRQILQIKNSKSVTGSKPILRFYHKYITETTLDGGVVEISTDGGIIWENVGDRIFRNPYDGFISYGTFIVPNFPAFWGFSNAYKASYIDLSDWQDEDILFRFQFGTNESGAPSNSGWYIDDIEMMDMFNYNGEACVSSDEGNMACTFAPEGGTIVDTDFIAANNEINISSTNFYVFPNPAKKQLNVVINNTEFSNGQISVLTVDGKKALHLAIPQNTFEQTIPLDISTLAAGFYFVKIQTEKGSAVRKVVIE